MLLLQCFVVLLGTVGAQEFPFAQLAKFEDAAFRFRTNVCDRQKALLEGSLDLRHALQGLNLTVAITNYVGVPNEEYLFALEPPLNQIPVKDPGLFAVLLDELAVRAGFTWRNTFVAVDPLTTVESEEFGKSWTDLLEWEVTNFDSTSNQHENFGVTYLVFVFTVVSFLRSHHHAHSCGRVCFKTNEIIFFYEFSVWGGDSYNACLFSLFSLQLLGSFCRTHGTGDFISPRLVRRIHCLCHVACHGRREIQLLVLPRALYNASMAGHCRRHFDNGFHVHDVGTYESSRR